MQFLGSSHLSVAVYSLRLFLCFLFFFSSLRVVSRVEAPLTNKLTHVSLPLSSFFFPVAFYASVFQNPDRNLLRLFFSTSLRLLKSTCFPPGPTSSEIPWIRDTCRGGLWLLRVVIDQVRVFGRRMNIKDSRRQSRQCCTLNTAGHVLGF